MSDFATAKSNLIALLEVSGIYDPAVLKAMLQVPRHLFVNHRWRKYAYADSALPIGAHQTISQPFIVAFMTQEAHLTPHSRVLEIGTGSGYQTAILAELCAEVFTVERLTALAQSAHQRLDHLGYRNIHFKIGDGHLGWRTAAPFDAIIVTAASEQPPPALLQQLAANRPLIIPLQKATGRQTLVKITKSPQEPKEVVQELLEVRFVPLV